MMRRLSAFHAAAWACVWVPLALASLAGCGGGTSILGNISLAGVTDDLTTTSSAGAISGEVLFEDDTPAPGVTVELTADNVDTPVTTTTDRAGLFRFGNVPPATFTLNLTGTTIEDASDTVTVKAGVVTAKSLTVSAAAEAAGG